MIRTNLNRRTPLRRYTPLRSSSKAKRTDPEEERYLQFIRQHACLASNRRPDSPCRYRIEVHHVRIHGEKRRHRRSVPLCAEHHREGPLAVHRIHQTQFERQFEVSFAVAMARLNQEWEDLCRSGRKRP